MPEAIVQRGRFYTSDGVPSHFTVEELWCPCCHEWSVQQCVIDSLEKYRGMVGEPVYITSGFRCTKYNADPKVGGAMFSRHPMGLAVDHELRSGKFNIWRASLVAVKCFYRTIIVPNRFIHVDNDESGGFGVILVRVKVGKKNEYHTLFEYLKDTTAGILLDGQFGNF